MSRTKLENMDGNVTQSNAQATSNKTVTNEMPSANTKAVGDGELVDTILPGREERRKAEAGFSHFKAEISAIFSFSLSLSLSQECHLKPQQRRIVASL